MNPSSDKIHALSRAVAIDQEHILLCKTLDLDPPFYFLPGGHIEHKESAENAVLRELREEANAPARIKGFLGVLEHSFTPGHNSICHDHEYNFYFEVDSDTLKFPNNPKQVEKHIALFWMPLKDLDQIDLRPSPMRNILGQWLKDPNTSKFQSEMADDS